MIVFFIILVANVGGALTPLGDPPLFVGFLRGVDFFWTARHLWLQTAIVAVLVLAMLLRRSIRWLASRRGSPSKRADRRTDPRARHDQPRADRAHHRRDPALGGWKPGVAFDVFGTKLELQNLARDGALIVIALLSLWLTPDEHRAANGFTWEPIREVAKLFAAIFVAIMPVLAMLQAGREGQFACLLSAVTGE